jgi:SpoVK/Ycf46/Vps4 family AAA+-type ATPase
MIHSEKILEILERDKTAKELKNLLLNFEENCKNINYKKGFYVYGSPGCGKSHFVTQILQDLNYDIIKYDAGDVRNKSLIETITSDNMGTQNVLHMMTKTRRKIAIIMDEIDGMNNGDKGGINSLIKLIRQKKTKKQKTENMTLNPIICIGNYFVDKKIKELIKVCNTFELKSPSPEQISSIISLNMPQIDPELKPIAIEYIQGDMRKLFFVEKMYKTKPELLTIDTMQHIFQTKSYNDDAKQVTKTLLTKSFDIDHHITMINETDRTIIALLWHENIVDYLEKIPNSKSFPFYLRILENICYADYIDRITFQNQIWQFNEMSSLMKTFYNNKLYHEHFPNQKINDNEIRFTKVLTKYSTEYNNYLFIFSLCQALDMDRKDLVAFFQELRIFFGANEQNDKLNELEKVFENENVNKLDIKRMYRYLDRNVKNLTIDDLDCDDNESN